MAFTDWEADDYEVEVEDEVVESNEAVVEEQQEVENVEESTTEVQEVAQTFNINGQELTLEEIKKGYMRQEDYLKKLDEANNLRKENAQALELVDYLRKNPNLAQKLKESDNNQATQVVDPAMQRIQELERQMYVQRMDNQISNLKNKYPDFNEVEVLNKAVQMGVNDLEFVHNAMRGAKLEDIIAQKVKEQLANATEQMQSNAQKTRTVIGSTKESNVTVSHNLTQQEMRVADLMGMSYQDYAKYK